MKFERAVSSTDDPLIKLVTERELGFTETEKTYLLFPATPYANLKRKNDVGIHWGKIFNPTVQILNLIDTETKDEMCRLYVTSHIDMMQYVSSPGDVLPNRFMRVMGETWGKFFDEKGIWNCVINYIRNRGIRLAEDDFQRAGTRPQDTEAATFNLDQGMTITAMAIVSKLMTPLFAAAMDYFQRLDNFDTDVKTVYISNLILPIFEKQCPDVLDKYRNYIEMFVNKLLYSDPKKTMAGLTKVSVAQQFFGKMLVQAFVNMNMATPRNNPLTYTRTTIMRSIKHIKGQTQFSIRDPAFYESDDGSSIGTLEVDSIASKSTMLSPVLTRCLSSLMATRIGKFYGISRAELDDCCNFYIAHPFVPGFLTRSLISGFFSPYMDGGQTLNNLNFSQFVELTSLVQLICFIARYQTLGHLITSLESNEAREQTTMESVMLNDTWRSPEYRECTKRYTIISERIWEESIYRIVRDIASTKSIANTAPLIWKEIEVENKNGKIIPLDSSTGRQIAAFVYNYVYGELSYVYR